MCNSLVDTKAASSPDAAFFVFTAGTTAKEHKTMNVNLRQSARWIAADVQTPISLFLGLVGNGQGILLESAEVDGRWGRYSVIGFNFLLRLGCRDGKLTVASRDARLDCLKELEGMDFTDGVRAVQAAVDITPASGFEDLPPITRGLYGYFGYGVAGMFEPHLQRVLPVQSAEACLVLPGTVVLVDHLYNRLCLLNLAEGFVIRMDRDAVDRKPENPDVGPVVMVPDKATFIRNVERVKELIRQGEAIQVVLSTRFQASFKGDPFVLYRRLRQINPSPYMFFMRLPGVSVLGSSPEVLVRCRGGEVQVCPIAGTRPRGSDEAEDMRLAEELRSDPKEQAEHVMLVDLGRNDLGRIAEAGTVSVEKYMQVERFSHVMHLTSYVRARLAAGRDALDVLAATFPAGTVSGAPKVRAMEIIADMEGLARGPYAGAIGWLGLDSGSVDMDTGILIRSMWERDGMVSWQAGAGIVYDSVPEKEWEECCNKARVVRSAITGTHGGGSTGDCDVFAYR
jgi:anthranilate synthase component 1